MELNSIKKQTYAMVSKKPKVFVNTFIFITSITSNLGEYFTVIEAKRNCKGSMVKI